jgi:hypothetical protein
LCGRRGLAGGQRGARNCRVGLAVSRGVAKKVADQQGSTGSPGKQQHSERHDEWQAERTRMGWAGRESALRRPGAGRCRGRREPSAARGENGMPAGSAKSCSRFQLMAATATEFSPAMAVCRFRFRRGWRIRRLSSPAVAANVDAAHCSDLSSERPVNRMAVCGSQLATSYARRPGMPWRCRSPCRGQEVFLGQPRRSTCS